MRKPTQSEIAKHLDLGVRRLRDFLTDGVIEKGCTLDEARVAYIRWLREMAAGRAGTGNPNHEKARYDKLRADQVELKIAVEKSQLIPLELATSIISKMIMAARSHFLSLPTKLAPRVHGCKTLRETSGVLKDGVHECLGDFTRIDPTDILGEGAVRARGAAAKPNRKRVGRPRKKAKSRGKRRARPVAD